MRVLPVANIRTTSSSRGDSGLAVPLTNAPALDILAAMPGDRRWPVPVIASTQICLRMPGSSFFPTMASTPISLMRVSSPPLVNIVKTTIGVFGRDCLSRWISRRPSSLTWDRSIVKSVTIRSGCCVCSAAKSSFPDEHIAEIRTFGISLKVALTAS
ncbi:hypothetical protein D3C72_1697810 [compost metagenome]